MKRKIAYYGEPVLRKKGAVVAEFDQTLKQLYDDMLETMYENNGMGLAAPQVFESLSLFITAPPCQKEDGAWELAPPRLYVNPKILSVSKETWTHDEACVSIPKLTGLVIRPIRIEIEAQDIEGNVFQETLEEWPARVFLHENDHTNGVLFIDRLNPRDRKQLEVPLREIKKKYAQK